MRTRTRTDISGLQRKMGAVLAELPDAGKQLVGGMGHTFIAFTQTASPRDTQRYVAGWAQAGNAAGVGPFAVPAIGTSKYFERAVKRLEAQLRWFESRAQYWAKIVENRYVAKNRSDRWKRDAERKRDVRMRRAQRARDQLEKLTGTSIVIGLWSSIGGKTGHKISTTVREKIYGGEGSLYPTEHGYEIKLKNAEPHASIVEKKYRIVRRARAAARTEAIQFLARHYKDRIRKAAS